MSVKATSFEPNWPGPPIWAHWTLENPYPLALALAAVAAGLWWVGRGNPNPRRRRTDWLVEMGLLAAGLLLILLAAAVATSRERISANTRALVEAARDPMNLDAIDGALAPEVRLVAGSMEMERPMILNMARVARDKYHVPVCQITRLLARCDDGVYGQTYFAVLGKMSGAEGEGGFKMKWLLDWRKQPDGSWKISRLQWLAFNDQPVQRAPLP